MLKIILLYLVAISSYLLAVLPTFARLATDRCHLKGKTGDKLHAVLCATGYDIQSLLRMIQEGGDLLKQALFLPAKVGVFDVAQLDELVQIRPKQSVLGLKMNKSGPTISRGEMF